MNINGHRNVLCFFFFKQKINVICHEEEFYIERDLSIYFRHMISTLAKGRADECFWPVTVVDVAVSRPPTVVLITSVVSEGPRAVCRSVSSRPGVTDTLLSAFRGKH